MKRLLPVLALATAMAPAAADPLALEVALAPEQATVGELVAATLTLRGAPDDPSRAPRFPDWSRGWGEVEVLRASQPQRVDSPGGAVWRQQLVLAAYSTGRLTLPPFAVAVPGDPPVAVTTPDGLALEIRSVLPAEPEARTPKPPAPPRRLEVPAAFAWTATALALVAAAAALLLARRRRPVQGARATPAAPWEEFVRRLDALDGGDPEHAHVELSLAVRRFLGRSFGMPAAQASTSELGRRLGRHGLERGLVRRTVRLLREIDQIKFARAAATPADLARRLAEARAVASDVELHLHPPPAEAAA